MPAWAAAMERRLTRQMDEITEDLKDDVANIMERLEDLRSRLTSIDGQLNGMTNSLIRIEINAARVRHLRGPLSIFLTFCPDH